MAYDDDFKLRVIPLWKKHFGVKSRVYEELGVDKNTLKEFLKDERVKKGIEAITYDEKDMYKLAMLESQRRLKGYKAKEKQTTYDKDGNVKEVKVVEKTVRASDSMLQFVLERQGKDNGWVNRNEITGKDGEQINFMVNFIKQDGNDNH